MSDEMTLDRAIEILSQRENELRRLDEPIVVAYGISEEDAITALEEILEAD